MYEVDLIAVPSGEASQMSGRGAVGCFGWFGVLNLALLKQYYRGLNN